MSLKWAASGEELTFARRARFFEQRIVQDGECWRWTGVIHVATKEKGGAKYGKAQFWQHGEVKERWYAHRLSWFLHRGEIPDGYTIDHLCRNTLCVNPDHLEPVPNLVNISRATEHYRRENPRCPQGHDDWTTYDGRTRFCSECARVRARKNLERRKGQEDVR